MLRMHLNPCPLAASSSVGLDGTGWNTQWKHAATPTTYANPAWGCFLNQRVVRVQGPPVKQKGRESGSSFQSAPPARSGIWSLRSLNTRSSIHPVSAAQSQLRILSHGTQFKQQFYGSGFRIVAYRIDDSLLQFSAMYHTTTESTRPLHVNA